MPVISAPGIAGKGGIQRLVEKTRAGEIQLIYIAFPMRAEERIRSVLDQLADSTGCILGIVGLGLVSSTFPWPDWTLADVDGRNYSVNDDRVSISFSSTCP